MSEKVLGFKKQKTICHYCDKLGEPKMLTFLCKDCVKIPIFDKKDKIKLVPIVSVEWLKRWCKENTVLVDAKGNRAHVSRSKLYDAVSLQAVSK